MSIPEVLRPRPGCFCLHRQCANRQATTPTKEPTNGWTFRQDTNNASQVQQAGHGPDCQKRPEMHPTWFRCFNRSSTRPSVRNAHGRLEKNGGGNCVRSCLCAEVPHEGGIFVLCFWCLLLLMFLCARSASAALFENKNRPHRAHNAHLCAHQAQLPRANQLVRQASISAGQMLRLSQMWRWRLAKRKQTHPTIKAAAFIGNCFTQAWKPHGALQACETKQTEQGNASHATIKQTDTESVLLRGSHMGRVYTETASSSKRKQQKTHTAAHQYAHD